MLFGAHADITAKEYGASGNTGFTDYNTVDSAGNFARRSYASDRSYGGVGCLCTWVPAGAAISCIGARLLYDGDERTVHVIDDSTEEL